MPRRGRPKRPSATAQSHRGQAAGGEHQPEVERAAAHALLDDPRQQDLDRPHEQQVGHRGAGERRPQPRVAAHEAPSITQVAQQRPALGHRPVAARGRHHQHGPRGHQERRAVQQEDRRPRPRPRRGRRRPPARPAAAPAGARAGPARWPASAARPAGSPAPARRTPARGTRRRSRTARSARPCATTSASPPIVSPASGPPTTPAAGRRPPAASAAPAGRWPRRRSAGTAIVGTVIAMPTSDIPVGPPPGIAYTCHAKATRNAPSPKSDAVAPVHSRRKSRSAQRAQDRAAGARRCCGPSSDS